jgi:hypothetical protein
MKLSLLSLASLACTASAFMAPAPLARRSSAVRMAADDDNSIALPFDKRPTNLDGTLPGDVGFDPVGFSNNPPRPWLIGGSGRSLKWYREAEIVHGRVAMLAALGWVFPNIYHWPGNADVGVDAFANVNPLEAVSQVPAAGLWQIAATVAFIELFRINRVIRGDKEPGDLGLGQGEGRWNPFGFKYTEEEYFEKQLQEIKNGRLAMVGILGLLLQASVTGKGIVQQLGGSFDVPEAVAKAGYYFPEGV